MIASVDLRTGNKVYAFYDDTCVAPGTFIETVESIQPRKIMTLEDRHWVSIENYSPIPLSPEILEKCGFVFRNFTYPDGSKADLYSYKIFQITIYYTGDGFGLSWILAGSQSCCGLQLLYLHQLQNLIHALTGEELNINL